MKKAVTLFLPIFCMLVGFQLPIPADAGDTLLRIKGRGDLRCGVRGGILGFSLKEPDGKWSGMDVDFCRALSAAVLGDPEKAVFVPLTASERFPSLKAREIDVLLGNTTWTLERETTLEVVFAGVLFHDAQGFVVSAKNSGSDLSQLNGAPVCVVKGTTHEMDLPLLFQARGLSVQPLVVDSQAKAVEALFAGQCRAFTSEQALLRAVQLKAPGGPEEYVVLPEQFSKEPMGPVVRRGDEEWFAVVRLILFGLIRAEETGIQRSNVRSRLGDSQDVLGQRWLILDGTIARALTIPPGWAVRAVESAGNYGEMFERNLGRESVLKLERGPNRLWSQGGLMVAPPFR